MIKTINGRHYQNLIDYGIRNLMLYCDQVNDLNVFPVPDGDTGTNMVRTLQNGFHAIQGLTAELPELSRRFSKAVVFGARGNSGVIVAQFFKGFSEGLFDVTEADCRQVVSALEQGVNAAYRAVAHPVEGTILTVLRESSEQVAEGVNSGDVTNVNDLISRFLEQAKRSLDNTPNLLPILKSAGVVDSGGAGILHVFSGMNKYLNDETIAPPAPEQETAEYVDYSRFDRASTFQYGYCTEFLLQRTSGTPDPDPEQFRRQILQLGESVVTVFQEDKIKVHVHTQTPEAVLAFAHGFGEFLSLKIENMSVQHSQASPSVEICGGPGAEDFAVIAVTQDPTMRDLFLEMGADVVVAGDKNCQPSTKDFLKAFETAGAKTLFVFPNSKNSNLAAHQAGGLYPGGEVMVFDTKSVAECYAALSMMDFEAPDKEALVQEIRQIIGNVYTVLVSQAAKDSVFDGVSMEKNDFVAFTGSELLGVAKERISVAARVMERVLKDGDRDTVTLFAGKNVPKEELDALSQYAEKNFPMTDLDLISTQNDTFDLLLSFE